MKYILWDEGFLEKVENYSGNQLNRKEDVGRLINIVRECGEEEEFENLVFTAKYICGMIRIVKNEHDASNAGNMDLIKADLNENIKKGVESLKKILSKTEEFNKEHFEKNYISLSAQNFENLHQFFSDLEAVKKYINYLKRLV